MIVTFLTIGENRNRLLQKRNLIRTRVCFPEHIGQIITAYRTPSLGNLAPSSGLC